MAKMKNSELENICKLLEDAYISPEQEYIIEENTDHRGKPVKMKRQIAKHSKIDYIIYRFDPDKTNIFPYFKPISGLRQICDYFIFAEDNKRFFVFLIELKKKCVSPISQLEASECFVNFMLERAKRVGLKIEKEIFIRKLGIKDTKPAEKKATQFYKNMAYDNDSYMLIQSQNELRLIQYMDAPFKE